MNLSQVESKFSDGPGSNVVVPIIAVVCLFLAVHTAAGQTANSIQFDRDIRPILSENCYFCHGPDSNQREAGLRLDVESAAGSAVQPGDSDSSELYLRISSDDSDILMPPADSNRQLSPTQIQLLKRWIDEGAAWAPHWAFAPIKKPELPTGDGIDVLIERELEKNKMGFSPEAVRSSLIRRVSLDLTGLPPTIQQQDEFLADKSPEAYSKMVDRYLASPAFGERMAWNWLDAARYADTNGYQGDNERTMWPWRDWVVKAYNENMPFDQFSIWQLAGDLIPDASHEQILATGFNRNHPINGEGGRIPEENRIEYGMDMAETTGTVWMGLTFNCCRCHDHKYDNLTQEDYYSLFAFFDQTPVDGKGGNAQTPPVLPAPSKVQQKQKSDRESRIAAFRRQMNQRAKTVAAGQSAWEELERIRLKNTGQWSPFVATDFNANVSKLKRLEDESILAFGPNPDNDEYRLTGTTPLKRLSAVRLDVLNHSTMNEGGLSRAPSSNFVLTDFSVLVVQPNQKPRLIPIASAQADYEQPNHPVTKAFDGDETNGWAVWKNGKQKQREHQAVFVFNQSVDVSEHAEIHVVLKHQSPHQQHNIGRFKLYFSDQPQPALPDANTDLAAALHTEAHQRSEKQTNLVKQACLAADGDYSALKKQIESEQELLRKLDQTVPRVMVMAEIPKPRKSYRLNRGSYEQPLNEVIARVPQMFSPLPANTQPNRLALANWLFDKSNPLTSRVAVNRLWIQFFGVGLVKTAEDFGVQGEPPSHPELLDWLAAEYRDSGWDTKHMIRLFLNSRTYRQSARTNSQLMQLDPENRLLARASRFRMPSWMLRDHVLAASGRLVRTIGGQPVNTYQPVGVWEEASFGKKVFKLGSGDELYRRTLYTFWRRIASPTMIFDNADRMTCSVKTYRTNTPLHALNTLNDITFVEASRLMATKALNLKHNDSARLDFIFRSVLTRLPDITEKAVLMNGLNRTRRQFNTDRAAAKALVSIGLTPVDPKLEAVELASWTSLCLAIVNLDEALTRQ